jgi:hypothetical protein
MAYEKYTIRQFEMAWFNQDYSSIKKDDFEVVYTEYVDTTGSYVSEQFNKVVYIRMLLSRINTVNFFISLQKRFTEIFEIPYVKSFPVLEQYGYFIEWNGDKEAFLKELDSIQSQESCTESDLKVAAKELEEMKASSPKKEESLKQKRENWIISINSLVKLGYTIDKDKTTVEELAYIIKYEKEQYLKNKK